MPRPAPPAIVLPARPAAFAVLNCLRLARIPAVVLATDHYGHEVRSRYHRKVFLNSDADPDTALLEALSGLRGGVILPSKDSHVLFLTRHRALLERDFGLCIPPDVVVANLIDKSREARALRHAGFELPATESDLPADPRMLIDRLGTDSIILKPKMPESMIGLKTIHTRTDTELSSVYGRLAHRLPDLIAQAYVPGDPSRLWLCNAIFNARHELVSVFIYRKLRTKPVHNGVTTVGVSRWNPALVERVREFGRAMRYIGPADLEFKEDPTSGRYYYIETNPRFTLSCEFAARCGFNQVSDCYRMALGETVEAHIGPPREGVYYLNAPLDISARRRAGHSYARIFLDILILLPRPRVDALSFSVRDPWPFTRETLRVVYRSALSVGHRVLPRWILPAEAEPHRVVRRLAAGIRGILNGRLLRRFPSGDAPSGD